MATVDPVINDHLTRVQLRLLKQRLEQERSHTSNTFNDDTLVDERYSKLKDASERRRELLERLQQEQLLSQELQRPRTHPRSERNARHQPPRRTESQPLFSNAKQVIEHHYLPPRLDPLPAAPVAPTIIQQPYPTVLPAAPAPSIVQQPFYVQIPATTSSEPVSGNNRTDMYEMMMIQNAQMHQMIMQQLMLSAIPKPPPPPPPPPPIENHGPSVSELKDIINLKSLVNNKRPPSVHHHHYGPPPPPPQQQPQTVFQPAHPNVLQNGQLGPVQQYQLSPIQYNPVQATTAYPYTLPPIQVVPNISGSTYPKLEPYQWNQSAEHPSLLHQKYQRQLRDDE